MKYKKWREENPKYHRPLQESEEELWDIAQKLLMKKIRDKMISRIINGSPRPLLTEEMLDEIETELNEEVKYELHADGVKEIK